MAKVVQVGDPQDRVADAVTLESAVAKDLPGLHAGEDVLDASPDLFVGAIVLMLPSAEFAARRSAMRDHQASALVAAVGDGRGPADGCRPSPVKVGTRLLITRRA